LRRHFRHQQLKSAKNRIIKSCINEGTIFAIIKVKRNDLEVLRTKIIISNKNTFVLTIGGDTVVKAIKLLRQPSALGCWCYFWGDRKLADAVYDEIDACIVLNSVLAWQTTSDLRYAHTTSHPTHTIFFTSRRIKR
jgi:hypothetical protein